MFNVKDIDELIKTSAYDYHTHKLIKDIVWEFVNEGYDVTGAILRTSKSLNIPLSDVAKMFRAKIENKLVPHFEDERIKLKKDKDKQLGLFSEKEK